MSSTQKICTLALFASWISVVNGFTFSNPSPLSGTQTTSSLTSIRGHAFSCQCPACTSIGHSASCPCISCTSRQSTALRSAAEDETGTAVRDELLSILEGIDEDDDLDLDLDLDEDENENEEVSGPSERDAKGRLALATKNIDVKTLALLAEKGITHMTPIQEESYDPIFEGRDIIGRSRTGTGKTIAFCLPIVQALAQSESIDTRQRGRSPKVIVLLPTRELARQVEEQLGLLLYPHFFRAACFFGGTPYPPQERAVANGLDVLVATPGRLLDHLRQGKLDLSGVEYAVLDEADEMLNMGFSDDVEEIFSYFDVSAAQVLLFSATTPPWVAKIAKAYLKDPLSIDTVGGDDQTRLATTVRHVGIEVAARTRWQVLEDLVSVYGNEKRVIVFADTKRDCDDICTHAFKTVSASQLHGDMTQKLRDATLEQFKLGKFQVLVATDVAARGLDIKGVDLVVQLSPPRDDDSYVHRSGRTGRAGETGLNIILHAPDEAFRIRRLQQALNFRVERGALPSTEQVMGAIAGLAAESLDTVADEVVPYFRAAAEGALARARAAEDPEAAEADLLARALAAVSGKKSIERRSLLTGESGSVTITMASGAGQEVAVGDVFWAVGRLSGRGERFSDKVGKVGQCVDRKKLCFDVDAATAPALVAAAAETPLGQYTFEVCKELPPM
ncbi:unnamed protein product, partial [Heterosigma akashiwo]